MAKAKKDPLRHAFSTQVERLDSGMLFHVLPVPDEVASVYDGNSIRRLIATLNGHPVSRALMGPMDGGRYLIAGQDLMKQIGARLGSTVKVILEPDPDPDFIEVPEEFEIVLEQDPEARARWETFTKGRQRSLAVHLNGAKKPETRLKRALEIAEKLRTYTLHGDKPPRKDQG